MNSQQNLLKKGGNHSQQNLLDGFALFLKEEGRGELTVSTYVSDVSNYFKWLSSSIGTSTGLLYRQNILDFRSYLTTLKQRNSKTVNKKLSALKKYNDFLVSSNYQKESVITRSDFLRIQSQLVNPTSSTELEVKNFLQKILENEGKRDYALVTLMAYTGVRISEALNIKLDDFNLDTHECIIRKGKGSKQRIIMFNSKVINALKEYLTGRNEYKDSKESEYLFVSERSKSLDRTAVNRLFKKYSEKITPHQLRHFFCTNAIEKGMLIHEVANLAGHTNIATTMIYTNPDKEKLKGKLESL